MQTKQAFLVVKTNSIGDTLVPVQADWIVADYSYQALDQAQIDYGYCKIVKSMSLSDYVDLCIESSYS